MVGEGSGGQLLGLVVGLGDHLTGAQNRPLWAVAHHVLPQQQVCQGLALAELPTAALELPRGAVVLSVLLLRSQHLQAIADVVGELHVLQGLSADDPHHLLLLLLLVLLELLRSQLYGLSLKFLFSLVLLELVLLML